MTVSFIIGDGTLETPSQSWTLEVTPAPSPMFDADVGSSIRRVWLLFPDNSFEELLRGEVFSSDVLDNGALRVWAATDGDAESVVFVVDGIESVDNPSPYRMLNLNEERTYAIDITLHFPVMALQVSLASRGRSYSQLVTIDAECEDTFLSYRAVMMAAGISLLQ